MAQNVTQYTVTYLKHKLRLGRLWSAFSPLSAQLSCQPVTYFGLFMKYRHSFATILPLNHFVHHEISQLFVTILVQNTELSRLNYGKYSVGYHDLSVCLWNIALFDFIFAHVMILNKSHLR